jgi:hypothetical protein
MIRSVSCEYSESGLPSGVVAVSRSVVFFTRAFGAWALSSALILAW